MLKAVLLDLDGTLLDTAPDLAAAANAMLAEPYLHACRALGVAPAEAAVIGDSANDALAARAAGCRVLLVSYGYSEGRDVRSLDSDGVVDSLGEAAERLLAHTAG